jgi:hypothetical protein
VADLPFFRFHTSDWLADPAIRGLSMTARAVLIDVICLASQCPRRGWLESGGRPWGPADIAKRLTGDTQTNLEAIAELQREQAIKQIEGVWCYEPMVRDAEKMDRESRTSCSRASAGSAGARTRWGEKPPANSQNGKPIANSWQTDGKDHDKPVANTMTNGMANPSQNDGKAFACARASALGSEVRSQKSEERAAADLNSGNPRGEGASDAAPAAAAEDLEAGERRQILVAARIGEPVLSELVALKIPIKTLVTIMRDAVDRNKGIGVIVQNVRAAGEAHAAEEVQWQQRREEIGGFVAAWRSLDRDGMDRAVRAYNDQQRGGFKLTRSSAGDSPYFRVWLLKNIESVRTAQVQS